jgi:hypothetical protein
LSVVQNYFHYYSEIEERFTARRGTLLLLSTLDWALIDTWREAGVPLEAVLRGIDRAFDRHEARKVSAKSKLSRINGLAWCAQAVMEAANEAAEAAVGLAPASAPAADTGFEGRRIAAFLRRNAEAVAGLQETPSVRDPLPSVAAGTAGRLRELAAAVESGSAPPLDELDRTLTTLEERLLGGLRAGATEDEALALREAVERELAPFRTRLQTAQLHQVRAGMEAKRLLAQHKLPRLSLFYMGLEDEQA